LSELVDPLYSKILLISDIKDPNDILEKQLERYKTLSFEKNVKNFFQVLMLMFRQKSLPLYYHYTPTVEPDFAMCDP
jgi:hypothetical protein